MGNFNLSLWSVRNPAFALFAIFIARDAGVYVYVNLGRAADPTFIIKTMVVQAVWPGASAEDMQKLVAAPIELRRSSKDEKDAQIASVRVFQQRHADDAEDALRRLQQVAMTGGNVFGELMSTVRVATLGQITKALYAVGGEYRRNL